MVWYRRVSMTVGVTAAVLTVLAAPASAQEVTYRLAGVETAATSTQGTFAGLAISVDDFGTWGAVVLHEQLDDVSLILGGGFSLDGQVRNLQGLILPGGQIVRVSGSCRKETFEVTGQVMLLSTGELGEFEITLTHYGRRVPGGCITFFATVEGEFTFTPAP